MKVCFRGDPSTGSLTSHDLSSHRELGVKINEIPEFFSMKSGEYMGRLKLKDVFLGGIGKRQDLCDEGKSKF